MQNGIDDILIHATVAVDIGQGWRSKETEHFQVVPGTKDDFYKHVRMGIAAK